MLFLCTPRTRKETPAVEISEEASKLLARLNICTNAFNCVAHIPEDPDPFQIIPSITFKWDPRLDPRPVDRPECLQELKNKGMMDTINVRRNGKTITLYVMTPQGKRKGEEFFS